ncbi:hypothetical protein [Chryseobacterium indoltheticum]|uniref:hypothetical protein n=1 Tax=Chryseobacterium indoltheticum TaxID=254 RepID=UPI003F49879B
MLFFFKEEKLQFIINKNVVADCYISNQTIGGNHIISGGFFGNILLGDKSLSSQKFKFSVLNIEDFFGEDIEFKTEHTTKYSRGRILLKNKKFEILIDKDFNYKEKSNLLKEEGGFHILYNGEINFFKDSLNYKQINEIIEILSNFLSFVSGKKMYHYLCLQSIKMKFFIKIILVIIIIHMNIDHLGATCTRHII